MRRRQPKEGVSKADQRICTKENCLSCCKKFTAFMFSRIGLFFVMIGYVALGGGLFQALEADNEQNMRRSMNHELNATLYKLWDEILRVNSYPYQDKKGNFTLYATNELEKFEQTVKTQVQRGFDGRTRPDAEADWNYFGAILYAVTLVSTIGYGHITTKTIPGKIATILYSAFGVPLMMLFVANIGSTMARLFAFVFSRIKAIFCCRWKNKKKRVSLKSKPKFDQTIIHIDEKPPTTNKQEPIEEKPMLESTKSSTTQETKQLPADMRLNMLTGVSTSLPPRARSSISSASTTSERSKDALVRINALLRQTSVQDIDESISSNRTETQQYPRSEDLSPIQFYINETNKLTSNLENSINEQLIDKSHANDVNITLEVPNVEVKKSSTKNLKRSKSESTHNRKSEVKSSNELESSTVNGENDTAKTSRRRFFTRKLKKQSTNDEETTKNNSFEQKPTESILKTNQTLSRKSQSFNEPIRSLSPPPDYEESTIKHHITSLPTVTWKPDQELNATKTTSDFPRHLDAEDDDEFYEEEQASVPLLVTVFVLPLYLTLGAILFNIWEKWGFLNSFYFCFITLTTIGFGDFVPGSALTVTAAKEKLISAALYILLGLVLIAMCFNLMKEQISQKFKQVAGKWGISEI